jgi:hypothetical protein
VIDHSDKKTDERSLSLSTSFEALYLQRVLDRLQEYPKIARRVPLNAIKFLKNGDYDIFFGLF